MVRCNCIGLRLEREGVGNIDVWCMKVSVFPVNGCQTEGLVVLVTGRGRCRVVLLFLYWAVVSIIWLSLALDQRNQYLCRVAMHIPT